MTSAEARSESRSGKSLVGTSDENKHVGSETQVIVFFFPHTFKANTPTRNVQVMSWRVLMSADYAIGTTWEKIVVMYLFKWEIEAY